MLQNAADKKSREAMDCVFRKRASIAVSRMWNVPFAGHLYDTVWPVIVTTGLPWKAPSSEPKHKPAQRGTQRAIF